MSHTFHIPVLGLAFSIDTPLKVARYGISSVVSIVDDILIERMRKFHAQRADKSYLPIDTTEEDFRAKRITAYLNLLQQLVDEQFALVKESEFTAGSEITTYFELLPDQSPLKLTYLAMLQTVDPQQKEWYQQFLRNEMRSGSIDVNIMSKVDKINYDKNGDSMGDQYTDALSALRGFALSELSSSLILSAGMNPRLYSALETFPDFFPDDNGCLKKKIILKVSDFRSAFIQAKFLAKKGIWVSEFRVESGLNCGGHAFATEGYLLGPILDEFKQKRTEMLQTLFDMFKSAIENKGLTIEIAPDQRVTVQGGIGTSEEDNFLQSHYALDGTGWGSPFLLVPEATNVDNETLEALAEATQDDFYISGSSPLGVPFNNFRKSSAEKLRLERIKRGRPGSPCKKKYLVSDTEFTEQPICTASREYQHLKIKQLESENLSEDAYKAKFDSITEKVCLCEGLATSAYSKNGILERKDNAAVAICPGPNLAYFSGSFKLEEMIKHIYGKVNLLNNIERPNLFINELNLYVDYLRKDISVHMDNLNEKKQKYFMNFRQQLLKGIDYYKSLIPTIENQSDAYKKKMFLQLFEIEQTLNKSLL